MVKHDFSGVVKRERLQSPESISKRRAPGIGPEPIFNTSVLIREPKDPVCEHRIPVATIMERDAGHGAGDALRFLNYQYLTQLKFLFVPRPFFSSLRPIRPSSLFYFSSLNRTG